ncbi:hypothetical protein [Aeromonas rivipollensis]|uniref:hypothetical protein n=1 Tax=Aeromonas rivipollensis TaxID=948519 RepID=UPI0039893358
MKLFLHGQLTGQWALLIVHPMSYKRSYCILLNRLDQVSAQICSYYGGAVPEQIGGQVQRDEIEGDV